MLTVRLSSRILPQTILLLLILLTGFGRDGQLLAQTTLQPGDVGFLLLNMDGNNTDALGLVLLTDVIAGTSLVITDDEYTGSVLENNENEGRHRLTFSSPFPCGTQILIQDIDATTSVYTYQATVNGSTTGLSISQASTTAMQFSTSGDAIILFQDANANTTNPANFVAALSNSPDGFGTGGNSSQTALPPGLTVGTSAVDVRDLSGATPDEFDNVRFTCVSTNGTPSQLKGVLFDRNNWEGDNTNPYPVQNCAAGFSCAAACQDPVLTGITVNPSSGCPGVVRTITINGSLNGATEWVLRTGGCSGPQVATTTGNSFTVTPSTNTTYAVTALDCNSQTVCQTATASISAPAADAGADQFLSPGTSLTLAGNNPAPSTGQWSIISGDGNGSVANPTQFNSTFSGTAGQSYVLRWSISGGGCSVTTD
ncbi:MAG: hypothetical protein AAFN92_11665, partial [Bacteroidota bacterium]